MGLASTEWTAIIIFQQDPIFGVGSVSGAKSGVAAIGQNCGR